MLVANIVKHFPALTHLEVGDIRPESDHSGEQWGLVQLGAEVDSTLTVPGVTSDLVMLPASTAGCVAVYLDALSLDIESPEVGVVHRTRMAAAQATFVLLLQHACFSTRTLACLSYLVLVRNFSSSRQDTDW